MKPITSREQARRPRAWRARRELSIGRAGLDSTCCCWREKRDREKEVEVFEVAISPDFSLFFFFLSKPSYLPSLLLSLCFFGTTSSSRSRGASTSF